MPRGVTILAAAAILAVSAISACADIDAFAVKSYMVLVPDYSKTSGGSLPALSPDGKTLVYQGMASPQLLVQRYDPTGKTDYDAWKLSDVSVGLGSSLVDGFMRGEENLLDWSPDGRRLAFCGDDGRLYLAEFDYEANKASVRALTEPKMQRDGKTLCGIKRCKWSPNGKMIAIVRSQDPSRISVYDLATGKETELAADGLCVDWGQPWSRDSKYLVYLRKVKPAGKAALFSTEIVIVSVDTKTKRVAFKTRSASLCVSWSPVSDTIAYTDDVDYIINSPDAVRSPFGMLMKKGENKEVGAGIWCVGVNGKNPRTLCGSRDPAGDPANVRAFMKDMKAIFERTFSSRLSPAQLSRLRGGKMTDREMWRIAVVFAAEKVGGEFYQYVKKHPETLVDIYWLPGAAPNVALAKVVKSTPEKKMDLFGTALDDLVTRIINSPFLQNCADRRPLWSPNGKKIAFVRFHGWTTCELVVLDVADGETRVICRASDIQCVAWSGDGRSIICQAESHTEFNVDDWQGRSYLASYPEIWLMELW